MECLFFVFKNYIQFLLDLQKGLHPNKPIICCCSVAKSYLTLWDPMDCSTPGSPVLHYLLEFVQIHVH